MADGKLIPVEVDAKPWWASTTVWLNLIGVLVMILTELSGLDFIQDIPNLNAWMVGILGVLNIILRVLKTAQPLTIAGRIAAPIKQRRDSNY